MSIQSYNKMKMKNNDLEGTPFKLFGSLAVPHLRHLRLGSTLPKPIHRENKKKDGRKEGKQKRMGVTNRMI